MSPTDQTKAAARELMRTWGAKPQIHRHWDEGELHWVDVASCGNSPVGGITAVGTLGLSEHDVGQGNLRVEIVGAFPTTFEAGANVAATCAFNAIKDGIPTRPDAIHPDVLRLYSASPSLPHILMVDPFLWEEGPRTLVCDDVKTAWLMMVPISESERVFAAQHGVGALTTLFEERRIDIFDLDRAPVA